MYRKSYRPQLFYVLDACAEINVWFGFSGSSVLINDCTLFQAPPKTFGATSRKRVKLLELDQC